MDEQIDAGVPEDDDGGLRAVSHLQSARAELDQGVRLKLAEEQLRTRPHSRSWT